MPYGPGTPTRRDPSPRPYGSTRVPALRIGLTALLAALGALLPAAAAVPAAEVPLLPSDPVGSIPGVFSVSGNGAASYEIPIEVPPGTAGVAPSLVLAYDSQAGNGYLGQGFSLRGLSAITRCTPERPVRGELHDIGYDESDRFCLDGVPLVAVEGRYGAHGTVYYTERQTWTRVVSGAPDGGCGGGPCYFIAWTRDGDFLEFGNTADSRVQAVSTNLPPERRRAVRVWAQNLFRDQNGNGTAIRYHHSIVTGEYYPASIAYTSNSRTGAPARRSVVFDYEDRPDPSYRWQGGVGVPVTRRLAAIRTLVDRRPVLRYELEYREPGLVPTSTLESVALVDGDGVALPRTRFVYRDSRLQQVLASPGLEWTCDRPDDVASWIDFDGDGKSDLACSNPQEGEYRVLLSRPGGLEPPAGAPGDGLILENYRCWTGSQGWWASYLAWIDFNGDGRSDLACASPSDGLVTALLSTGTGLVPVRPEFDGEVVYRRLPCLATGFVGVFWLDFDGDGRSDAVCADDGGFHVVRSTGSFLEPPSGPGGGTLGLPLGQCDPRFGNTLGLIDFNGDGRTDLACANRADFYWVMLSDGLRWAPPPGLPDTGIVLLDWGCHGDAHPSWADFNGDGLTDLLCTDPGTGSQRVRLSTGRSLVAVPGADTGDVVATTASCRGTDRSLEWVDWSGDGRADLACLDLQGSRVHWLSLSLGAVLPGRGALAPYTDLSYESGDCRGAWTFPDVGGSGIAEIACLSADRRLVTASGIARDGRESPAPPRLREIMEGSQRWVQIVDQPLTSPEAHTAAAGATVPEVDPVVRAAPVPLWVVTSYEQWDLRRGRPVDSYHYHYGGGLMEVGGRGWLGFASVQMTHASAAGRVFAGSTAYYHQDRALRGLPERIEHYDADGDLATAAQYSWKDNLAGGLLSGLGIYQAVLREERQLRYEGRETLTRRVEYQHDGYGFVRILHDHNVVSDPGDDLYVCTTYHVEAGATWRLGYPLDVKQTSGLSACEQFLAGTPGFLPGDLSWTKTSYDSRMNVIREGAWDATRGYFLTHQYTMDTYGNTIRVTGPDGGDTRLSVDGEYHTFVTSIQSPPNETGERLVVHEEPEPLFGTVLVRRDPNGNAFRVAVDGFGRPREVYGPDPGGREALLSATRYRSDDEGDFVERTWRTAWDGGAADVTWQRERVDGLGRTVRVERAAEAPHTAIVELIVYDDAGREVRRSLPHFEGDPAPWITTAYDARNRPVRSIGPDGTEERIEYQLAQDRIRRTIAYGTAEARTEVTYHDSLGRTRERVSPNGLHQTYSYDRLGRLTGMTTAPEERRWSWTYDSLGRLRTVGSPDEGTTSFTYNAVGRPFRETDAAGNWIAYDHWDGLGRLVRQRVSSADGEIRHDFRYDDPSAANGRGRLTAVASVYPADPSGSQPTASTLSYGYDAYGNLQAFRQQVAGATSNDAAVAYGYDPLGRVERFIYPDGSVRRHRYWVDGTERSVELDGPGFDGTVLASGADADALGQWRTRTYGDAVTMRREFFLPGEAAGKLRSLHGSSAAAGDLFTKEYLWDRHGELLRLTTTRDGERSVESFGYDDDATNPQMGYLTRAEGPYGERSYRYDRLGNRTRLDRTTYAYSPDTSRLAESSDGHRYGYHPDGALQVAADPERSLELSFDGRGLPERIGVRTAGDGGGSAAPGTVRLGPAELFRHDHAGRLFFRRKMDGTRVFWMPGFELTLAPGGRFETKYVPALEGPAAAITRRVPAAGRSTADPAALALLHRRGSPRWAFYSSWATARGWGRELPPAAPVGLAAALALAATLLLLATSRRRPRTASRSALGWCAGIRLRSALVPALVLAILVTGFPARAELVEAGARQEGVRFFLTDHRASTVAVTDEQGVETAWIAYLPFGGIDAARSHGEDDFLPKLGGHEWLPEIGLYDFGSRLYDPATGRFVSPDPARQFLSPYLFGGDSPESVVDPDGEFAILLAMIIIGAIAGAYMGAAAVNHDFNPAHWDWKSGKTWAGLLGGAAIGAVGGALGGVFAEAGVAAGIAGEMAIGAAENAAFTAMGGGNAREILESAGEGALFGGAFGALGAGVGSGLGRFARRGAADLEDSALAPGLGRAARRGAGGAEEAGDLGRGCSSFAAGTEVATADGPRAIETLAVGDRVWARAEGEREARLEAVTATFHRTAEESVRLVVGGEEIEATPEHPFWVDGRGWLAAGDLGVGDVLVDLRGEEVTLTALSRDRTPVAVYNLEVERAHTYYASGEQVLVHNPRCCCWPFGQRGAQQAGPPAPRRPLAGVLEGHGPGQGFTGVYDTADGGVLLKPSAPPAQMRPGFVPRNGGHIDVSNALRGGPATHQGFAAILRDDGTLELTWRSRGLNRAPD